MTFTKFSELYGDTCVVCRCNLCGSTFGESELLIEDETDREFCPECLNSGYIQSESETDGDGDD